MKIIKNYTDYIEDDFIKECLKNRFSSDVVEIEIKNRAFMIAHLKPNHDFIIHTTAMPCCEPSRMFA